MIAEHKDEEAIFKAAVKLKSAAKRTAYLKRACGNDAGLLARIEELLKAHDEAGDFLEAPPADVTLNNSGLTERPGSKVGRYKLLQLIGEGGFACVYMAEQEQPVRRRVALKIIKLGMDTKQVIGRFEAERQALALMEHPNIAKVFDGGATDTGRPYFVMELVKGIPITEYCDKDNVGTKQRLELFIDVCKAVQHAHQKGIIHRDIKPTNVLITLRDDGRPVPKIIDFGIAKATGQKLTEKTYFTEFKQFIGTPEYMSPEQAQMGEMDIDTRTDVYSLGVLLYELLAGTTPFNGERLRSSAYDEMLKTIRETEPPRPSTRLNTLGDALADVAKHRNAEPAQLCKIVRGELDWIVMKTLEKDRTRRYETANELARDIERHMNNEPVTAGPPGTVYRLRKFVRRNRTAVVVGLVVLASLIVGLTLATVGFVQASRQRDLAQEQRQRAETNFQMSFTAVDEMLKAMRLPRAVMRESGREIEQLPENAEMEELRHKLLQKAEVLYEEFLEKNRMDPAARLETIRAYDWVGEIHELFGQYEQAEQAYQKAINVCEELIAEFPAEQYHQHSLGNSLNRMGDFLRNTGRVKEAEQTNQKAISVWSNLIELDPDEDDSWHMRGGVYLWLSEWEKAAADYTKAIELDPNNSWYWNERGFAYSHLGQNTQAVSDYTKAIELAPYSTHYLHLRGASYRILGKPEKALADYTKAIELRPEDSYYWYMCGRCYFSLGEWEKAVANYTKAIELKPDAWVLWESCFEAYMQLGQPDRALSEITKLVESDPDNANYRYIRGGCYSKLGEPEKAIADYTKAVEADPNNSSHWHARGRAYMHMKDWDNALTDFTKAINLNPDNRHHRPFRAETYRNMKQWDKAIADYTETIEVEPDNHSRWSGRANIYFDMKQWDEAIADFSKAIELNPDAWGVWERRFEVYMELGQLEKALADYSSLIELKPQDARVRVSRGDCYYNYLKDYHKALEDYSAGVELDPNFTEAWYSRGLAYGALGQCEKAAFDFAKAVELGWDGAYNLYCQALAELGSSDVGRYRKTCKTMVERFGGAAKAAEIHRVVWTCVLAPEAVEDFSELVKLAEQLVQSDDKNEQYLNAFGGILYRSGRFEESAKVLSEISAAWENGKKLPTNFSPAYTWYFLAMAHYQSGNVDESLKYFAKAQEQAEQEIAGSAVWNRRLTLELLGAEAAELLGVTEEPVEKEAEIGK